MDFCNNCFVNTVSGAAAPIVVTALPTPFKRGKIHFDGLLRLVHFQQKHADALVVLGTTAEPNMLTDEERKQVLSAVKLCADLPVVCGISANDTATAVRQAHVAYRLGASALLVSPPSFSKCTTDGYIKHVLRIADESKLPIVLYNAPSRAGYALTSSVVQILAQKGVEYLKDAAADIDLTARATTNGVKCFCGNDLMYGKSLHNGAIGTISVAANISPLTVRAYAALQTRNLSSKTAEIRRLTTMYDTLSALCAMEVNPIAVKYLLYKAGIFDTYDVRLPLTKACRPTRRAIDEFWSHFGQSINLLNSEGNL